MVAWRTQLVSAAEYADALIEWGCKALLLVTGLALLALLSLGVVLRYFFQSGFSFAPDLSELLFAIFVMAGIVQAARLGVHVATQLLLNALTPRYRIALAVLIHALTATVYFLLGYYAFENAIIAHDQARRAADSLERGVWLPLGRTDPRCACSAITILRHTAGGEAVHVDLADLGRR